MNSMLFKDILIADVQKKKARFLTFHRGLNIITSEENHVGKSSILKALYSTLGAEVTYDNRWDKNSKLYAASIDVDGTTYRIVRFQKKFAIFRESVLILLTGSVTKEFAPHLAKIFDFSVFLPEKSSKKIIQAPPVFSFMPYYIDQDKGWSELYASFDNMEQFAKKERIKSIYFHLGLYTKSWIAMQAQKDILKDEIQTIDDRNNHILITVDSLTSEMSNIVPASNMNELETQLVRPKKEIEHLVKKIGFVRNRIQELQTSLQEHDYQLNIIRQFQNSSEDKRKNILHTCPKCGYEFNDDLYSLIRNSYNQSNETYLVNQIKLIIDKINEELQNKKEQYIYLMSELRTQEKKYDESQDAYNTYLRYKGLEETLRKYRDEYESNITSRQVKEDAIKRINKELKKIPDKKATEESYISHVKSNLIELGVWDKAYEGNIQLLKGIKAQGSLMPKVILSQYIGLYQTMNEMQSSTIRFPFIIDSPRSMEPSDTSSKEILNFIVRNVSLPQIILATVDYDKFQIEGKIEPYKIYLKEQFNVLNVETYQERKSEIEDIYNLFLSANSTQG